MNVTEPTTIRHRVGTCPACNGYLWAEVDLAVQLGKPAINDDGKAQVHASPYFMGMRVKHECRRNDDGAWESA